MPIPSTSWATPSIVSTPWNVDFTSANGVIMDDASCIMDSATITMDDAKANSVRTNSTAWSNP